MHRIRLYGLRLRGASRLRGGGAKRWRDGGLAWWLGCEFEVGGRKKGYATFCASSFRVIYAKRAVLHTSKLLDRLMRPRVARASIVLDDGAPGVTCRPCDRHTDAQMAKQPTRDAHRMVSSVERSSCKTHFYRSVSLHKLLLEGESSSMSWILL